MMNETYKGYTIKIEQDVYFDLNPRTENDNASKMVCFHGRYLLGDKHNLNSEMFDSWEEMKKHLMKKEDACIIIPLYLYDHSGITMSTSPFSCRWDSGQVGYAYMSRKMITENYGGKYVTKKLKERAEKLIRGEVKEYDLYLTGQIYRYTIKDEDDNHIDSCSGYLTDDTDTILSECKSIIDNIKK